MQSIGQKLEQTGGFGNGFGFARLLLATSIILWHSLSAAQNFNVLSIWVLGFSLLPMFFALSGFLVAGSARRLPMGAFFANRGARILPALVVEVFLSAIVLGAWLTTLPLGEYFTHPTFWRYFQNLVGNVQFELPGVSFQPPWTNIVNGVLWTVPYELSCYALMGLLLWRGLQSRTWILVLLAFALAEIRPSLALLDSLGWNGPSLYLAQHPFWKFLLGRGPGAATLPCFLLGLAIYAARYRIPHDGRLFALALGLLGAIGLGPIDIMASVWLPVLCVLWSYIIVFIGVADLRAVQLSGDYSYGLYLYSHPIQQVWLKMVPTLGVPAHFLLSLGCASLFAMASWYLVERPVLRWRKSFAIRHDTRPTQG